MTLRWEQVRIEAGSRTLLDPTDLDISPGQILAVVGPSGSGKTTTLLAVAGLARPADGRLLLDGVETWQADRRRIGVVTQPVLLASSLTVAENISVPMQTLGRPVAESRGRVAELMEQLSLAGVSDREPTRLSGGQRQRVAVARAVAAEPSLIVADEPTSELDHDSRELVVAILRQAAARSSVVVLSTHDDEVASRCDRVLTLG